MSDIDKETFMALVTREEFIKAGGSKYMSYNEFIDGLNPCGELLAQTTVECDVIKTIMYNVLFLQLESVGLAEAKAVEEPVAAEAEAEAEAEDVEDIYSMLQRIHSYFDNIPEKKDDDETILNTLHRLQQLLNVIGKIDENKTPIKLNSSVNNMKNIANLIELHEIDKNGNDSLDAILANMGRLQSLLKNIDLLPIATAIQELVEAIRQTDKNYDDLFRKIGALTGLINEAIQSSDNENTKLLLQGLHKQIGKLLTKLIEMRKTESGESVYDTFMRLSTALEHPASLETTDITQIGGLLEDLAENPAAFAMLSQLQTIELLRSVRTQKGGAEAKNSLYSDLDALELELEQLQGPNTFAKIAAIKEHISQIRKKL